MSSSDSHSVSKRNSHRRSTPSTDRSDTEHESSAVCAVPSLESIHEPRETQDTTERVNSERDELAVPLDSVPGSRNSSQRSTGSSSVASMIDHGEDAEGRTSWQEAVDLDQVVSSQVAIRSIGTSSAVDGGTPDLSQVELEVISADKKGSEDEFVDGSLSSGSKVTGSPSYHQRTPSGRLPPWKLDIALLEAYRKPAEELQRHGRKTRRFYKHQNQLLELFSEMDRVHHGYEALQNEEEHVDPSSLHAAVPSAKDQDSDEDGDEVDVPMPIRNARERRHRKGLPVRIAIYLSLAANFVLLVLKVIAFVQSGSLSVLASALDSFLDLLSGAILFITARLSQGENRYKYPAGKKRIEPVGVIVFSTAMFTATLQLVVETIQQFVAGTDDIVITALTLAIISVTVVVKFALWMYCSALASRSGAVRAFAVDHRNDVFSNLFGMSTALLGAYVYWVFDPLGALALAAYLCYVWGSTLLEQVRFMSGQAAPDTFHRAITYLCWNHHPEILQIDTVRAYHLSQDYMVEVDVVLPADMKLQQAHDIGESLQIKLESLERVERAFVHLDYETSHKPEH